MKNWSALLVLATAVAMPVRAADLPPGDCARPAAATDLSACDLSLARLDLPFTRKSCCHPKSSVGARALPAAIAGPNSRAT